MRDIQPREFHEHRKNDDEKARTKKLFLHEQYEQIWVYKVKTKESSPA